MKKILYLECKSGISGDMTVGALLDLGADRQVLEKALKSLGVDGYHLHFGRTSKCGIDAYDFDVHLEHEHSHVHEHTHDHSHSHDHAHKHTHNHEHIHSHSHGHIHRNIHDIYTIIDRLDAADTVKGMAKKIFAIVAEAEAKAHQIPIEKVHFHEVGAIDSIVDIVSVAVCIDTLGVEEVVVSPLAEGNGSIECQHGTLPVPVPATANIATAHGLALQIKNIPTEMVTPTGAAIVAALKTREQLPKVCRIVKIGIGAGKKNFAHANILRAMLIEDVMPEEHEKENMWVIESNIDDASAETLGFLMEKLFTAGARDVWYTPIYMKKNRPAYQLSVLYTQDQLEEMERIIFTHSSTIGIRHYLVERTILDRETRVLLLEIGDETYEMEVKVCTYKGRMFFYPEYESVKKICEKADLEYQTVFYMGSEKARQIWG